MDFELESVYICCVASQAERLRPALGRLFGFQLSKPPRQGTIGPIGPISPELESEALSITCVAPAVES
jgi:hypothetical protein